MVPVLLLRAAKIKRRQKILVGFFLSLSLCMIIISVVQVSGARIHQDVLDVQWLAFWNEVEATIATIMVSVTAFRQLLGMKSLKARAQRDRSWYYRRRLLFRKNFKKSSENEWDTGQLPSIPGAKLTGLRTLIRGGRDLESVMTCEDHGLKSRHDEERNIPVRREISLESEAVI